MAVVGTAKIATIITVLGPPLLGAWLLHMAQTRPMAEAAGRTDENARLELNYKVDVSGVWTSVS
jgi:hypothetical protein